MRISDWSSDVCSSDLCGTRKGWPCAGPFRVKVADKRGRERCRVRPTEAADDGDGRFLATPEATQVRAVGAGLCQIGRASGRERVCQSVEISVGAGSLKKKKNQETDRQVKQKEH